MLDCPGGPFTISAFADRVELRRSGGLVIVDYKSGAPPSIAEVAERTARQLPIEAIIAEAGGFPDCPAGPVEALEYWRAGGGNKDGCIIVADTSAKRDAKQGRRHTDVLVATTYDGIRRYAGAFDDEATPYLAEPRPEFRSGFNEYRHLSRRDEWSRTL